MNVTFETLYKGTSCSIAWINARSASVSSLQRSPIPEDLFRAIKWNEDETRDTHYTNYYCDQTCTTFAAPTWVSGKACLAPLKRLPHPSQLKRRGREVRV